MTRLAPLLLVFVVTCVSADDAAILDKDFRTMMQWFPGVYDNQEQVYFEAEQEVDEALRHAVPPVSSEHLAAEAKHARRKHEGDADADAVVFAVVVHLLAHAFVV